MPEPIPAPAPAAPGQPLTSWDQDSFRNDIKTRALQAIGLIGLAGIGVGGGVRAGQGLADMLTRDRRNTALRKEISSLQPATLKVPYPVYEDNPVLDIKHPELKEKKRLEPAIAKRAGLSYVPPIVGKVPGTPSRGAAGWLAGDTHDTALAMPWVIPGVVGALTAGPAVGYKGVGLIADWLKGKEEDEDLATAREEYRMALLEPHLRNLKKTSAMADDLDKLARLVVEKQAGIGSYLGNITNNAAGGATGAYAVLAALLAGGTGYAAYQYGVSNNPQKKLKERLKQEMVNQWAQKPPSVYAVPVPIKVPRNTDRELAEEQSGAISDLQNKAATFVKKHADLLG